jgi:hypothetical protein
MYLKTEEQNSIRIVLNTGNKSAPISQLFRQRYALGRLYRRGFEGA